MGALDVGKSPHFHHLLPLSRSFSFPWAARLPSSHDRQRPPASQARPLSIFVLLSLQPESFSLFPSLFLSLKRFLSLSLSSRGSQLLNMIINAEPSSSNTRQNYGFRGCRRRCEELCTPWDSAFGRGGGRWKSHSLPLSCRRLRPLWVASLSSMKFLSSS